MHAWGNPNQERPRGDTINGQLYAAESAGLRPAALGIQEVVEGTDAPTIAVAVGVAVAVAVAVAVVVVVAVAVATAKSEPKLRSKDKRAARDGTAVACIGKGATRFGGACYRLRRAQSVCLNYTSSSTTS